MLALTTINYYYNMACYCCVDWSLLTLNLSFVVRWCDLSIFCRQNCRTYSTIHELGTPDAVQHSLPFNTVGTICVCLEQFHTISQTEHWAALQNTFDSDVNVLQPCKSFAELHTHTYIYSNLVLLLVICCCQCCIYRSDVISLIWYTLYNKTT